MENSDIAKKAPFSGACWVRNGIPVDELNGSLCLIRVRQGHDIREGLFTIEARAHYKAPEFRLINARRTAWDGHSGTTEVLVLDQYRADQLRRADGEQEYAFVAEFDRDVLHYVPEIQEFMEKRLMDALEKIDHPDSPKKAAKTDIIELHFEDRCPYEVGNCLTGPISHSRRSHIGFPGVAEIVAVNEVTGRGEGRRQFEAKLKVTLPDHSK